MGAKLLYATTTVIALLSASAAAFAEQPEAAATGSTGVTRSQVRSELMQAIQDGTLVRTDADIEHLGDLRNSVSVRSRDAVRKETAQATHDDLIPRTDADIERIARAREEIGTPMPRQQVAAELAEARRLGLIPAGERDTVATSRQTEQIRLAGQRALQEAVAQVGSKQVLPL